MKNLKMTKIFFMVVIFTIMFGLGMKVMAADGDNVVNITPNIIGNNNVNTNTNNANVNTNNTNILGNINNTAKNTSLYNNTSNLPKTGAGDNTMIFIIIAICGVSAIYAFKKISDYKNV